MGEQESRPGLTDPWTEQVFALFLIAVQIRHGIVYEFLNDFSQVVSHAFAFFFGAGIFNIYGSVPQPEGCVIYYSLFPSAVRVCHEISGSYANTVHFCAFFIPDDDCIQQGNPGCGQEHFYASDIPFQAEQIMCAVGIAVSGKEYVCRDGKVGE